MRASLEGLISVVDIVLIVVIVYWICRVLVLVFGG